MGWAVRERLKSCIQCQQNFSCSFGDPQGKCWCMDMPNYAGADLNQDCLCPSCLQLRLQRQDKTLCEQEVLQESRDFYFENGLMVLSEAYLIRRGYCCQNGCRNCPY